MRVTPSLFDIIGDLEEDNAEENFDYVSSLMNTDAINEMSEFRKAEAERKSFLLSNYYSDITNE